MDPHLLNLWAILVAALSAFLVGGLWYSRALFGAIWERSNGFAEPPQAGPRIFILSFIFSLVMAVNLAFFLAAPNTTAAWGATAGFLAGFGWAAMCVGIIALFERRSWTYVLVNGGYVTVALTLMGLILGAWRK